MRREKDLEVFSADLPPKSVDAHRGTGVARPRRCPATDPLRVPAYGPFVLWTPSREVDSIVAMVVNAEPIQIMPGARAQQRGAASPGLVILILMLAALCASLVAVAFVVAPPGPAIGIGPLSVPEPVRIGAGIAVLISRRARLYGQRWSPHVLGLR